MRVKNNQHTHVNRVFNNALEEPADAETPLDDIIARSWRRCVNEYGLDPSHPQPTRILTSQQLREHRDRVDEFLSVARSGVEQLYAQVAGQDYVLLLSDDRGIIVEYLGSDLDQNALKQSGLYLGADWNEHHTGTCGVGTALKEGTALTCHRDEHFDVTNLNLSCTSVPILSPKGNVMAVLDISSLRPPQNKNSQNFARVIVNHYARLIEDAYFIRNYRDKHIFRFGNSRDMVHVSGQHLLAIEDDGTVIAANTAGRELLGTNLQTCERLVGQSTFRITDVFDCDLADVFDIPFSTDDRARAFRQRNRREFYFATLIEPVKKSSSVRKESSQECRVDAVPDLDTLTSDDPTMRSAIRNAKRLRDEPVNLLIVGETGTGKECVARAVHDNSSRAAHQFVAVNCAAIPESLIESELFGYVAGSFTGAHSRGMKGLVAQADGGTLFLDEIGDMPVHLQTRLLRVIAEQEVQPVGADRPVSVDLRVIAATHQDVRRLIGDSGFRQDLYYRINGATLKLPPLRARADLEFVIRSVFERIRQERGIQIKLRGDAMSSLLAHNWPGNIRELENALRFAIATCEEGEVSVGDLPDELTASRQTTRYGDEALPAGREGGADSGHDELAQALRDYQWNIAAVARALGISRPTVYRRMRTRGIVDPRLRE